MGKGGTKFEGDAVGIRGKTKVGLSAKEMRKNMVRRGQRERKGANAVRRPKSGDEPFRPVVLQEVTAVW
jgi:hypothetical protein